MYTPLLVVSESPSFFFDKPLLYSSTISLTFVLTLSLSSPIYSILNISLERSSICSASFESFGFSSLSFSLVSSSRVSVKIYLNLMENKVNEENYENSKVHLNI